MKSFFKAGLAMFLALGIGLSSQTFADDNNQDPGPGVENSNPTDPIVGPQGNKPPMEQWLDDTGRRAEFDTDGDGKLNIQERASAWKAYLQENPPQRPQGQNPLGQRLGGGSRPPFKRPNPPMFQAPQPPQGDGENTQDQGTQN
ncbi:MAG: hypothetical protein HYS07_03765 [Chlamydiae bacterium]|nr:hypothetical protein [Chlamydiota bacterium]MBI3277128.1 hypothetical protein [Chlamydiota bacterium]